MPTAFDPVTLGGLELPNRIVMAPMTRSRAAMPGATATPLMAEYYAQRAGAGLIITEGIQPNVVGEGYMNTPACTATPRCGRGRPSPRPSTPPVAGFSRS